METDQTYQINPRIAYRKIGEQMVLVHSVEETLLTLNTTGTAIWERIEGNTVEQIAKYLAQLFEVDFENAVKDTIEFLGTMETRGFIEVAHQKKD